MVPLVRTQSPGLGELFGQVASGWSDIQGHLDLFVHTARESETIIELGVRSGVSTVAWLHGLEGRGHLWSVDIEARPELIPDVDNWTFIQGDDCSDEVLDQLPGQVDVVFIDTSHFKAHTLRELELYYPRVRAGGRIFLHDTELDLPEGAPADELFPVKQAIVEFCTDHELVWTNYQHSYGLGVIEV